jgi:hypothetical protein
MNRTHEGNREFMWWVVLLALAGIVAALVMATPVGGW